MTKPTGTRRRQEGDDAVRRQPKRVHRSTELPTVAAAALQQQQHAWTEYARVELRALQTREPAALAQLLIRLDRHGCELRVVRRYCEEHGRPARPQRLVGRGRGSGRRPGHLLSLVQPARRRSGRTLVGLVSDLGAQPLPVLRVALRHCARGDAAHARAAGRGRHEEARAQGRQHVHAHAARSGRRPSTDDPLARRAAHSRSQGVVGRAARRLPGNTPHTGHTRCVVRIYTSTRRRSLWHVCRAAPPAQRLSIRHNNIRSAVCLSRGGGTLPRARAALLLTPYTLAYTAAAYTVSIDYTPLSLSPGDAGARETRTYGESDGRNGRSATVDSVERGSQLS